MLKKYAFYVVFIFVLLASGCQTTKGVATGMGATVEGAAKDTYNFWQAIQKFDNWIKEYLW